MIDDKVRELLSAPQPDDEEGTAPEVFFAERKGSGVALRVFHYPQGPEVEAWLELADQRCEALGGDLNTEYVEVFTANSEGEPPDIVLGIVSGQDLAVKPARRARKRR